MVFSASRLEVLGLLFSAAVMLPLMMWLIRIEILNMIKRMRPVDNISRFSVIGRLVVMLAFLILFYFALTKFYTGAYSLLLLFCLSLLIFVCQVIYVKRLFERNNIESIVNGKFSDDGRSYKNIRYNSIILIYMTFLLFPLAGMGGVALFRWLTPDICEVKADDGGYETVNYYGWPKGHSVSLTHSYLENNTKDTLYRFAISYAYLGEESYNLYNVTNTIKPGEFTVISNRPNYVMKRILPVMPSSSGRMGRYHTNRVYIVDRRRLDEFERRNMQCFGLRGNKKIDSLDITKNDIIYEDPEKYITLERVTDNIERNCRENQCKDLKKALRSP